MPMMFREDPRKMMTQLIDQMVVAADGILMLCEANDGEDIAADGYPPSLDASFEVFLHELIEWREAQKRLIVA